MFPWFEPLHHVLSNYAYLYLGALLHANLYSILSLTYAQQGVFASRSSTKTIRGTSRSITAALIEADGLQY